MVFENRPGQKDMAGLYAWRYRKFWISRYHGLISQTVVDETEVYPGDECAPARMKTSLSCLLYTYAVVSLVACGCDCGLTSACQIPLRRSWHKDYERPERPDCPALKIVDHYCKLTRPDQAPSRKKRLLNFAGNSKTSSQ